MNCLANTGFELWIPLTAGAVVLALGVAFWLVSRRLKSRGAAALGLTLLLVLGAGALGTAAAPSAQAAQPCPPASSSAPTVPVTPAPTSTPTTIPTTPAATAPDLTDLWTIPNPVFTSYTEIKTVVLTLTEVNGVETTDGTIVFRITKPSAFTFLPYDPTATSATPAGGTVMTVSNSSFVFSENANFITLTAAPGVGIGADGSVSVAFQLQVVAGTASGAQQNISAVIIGDPTLGYDSNGSNNTAVFNPSYQAIDLTPTITAVPDVVPVTGTPGVLNLTAENLNLAVPSLAGTQLRILATSSIYSISPITDPNWTMTLSGIFYVFTYNVPIQPGQTVSLSVPITYTFGAATTGSSPVTVALLTGTGGDSNILNNSASDVITFGNPIG